MPAAQASAQVILEQPRRLLLDSLVDLSGAAGQEIHLEDVILYVHPDPQAKGGGSVTARLWPEGRVPYLFSTTNPLPPEYHDRVRRAMRTWEEATGGVVSFQELSGPVEHEYVEIQAGTKNSSFMGRVRPAQALMLIPGGASTGTILHELGHALGLLHEQSRSDRDRFVQVITDNVHPDKLHNFGMRESTNCTDYDFASVMHYSPSAFSRNGLPTIVPHPEFAGMGTTMGSRVLSPSDVTEILAMYTGVCSRPTDPVPSGGGTNAAVSVLRATGPARWVLRGPRVPSAQVREGWSEGLTIVTAARTPEQQVVVMSQNRRGVRQSFHDSGQFPNDFVRARWDEGYAIQHASYGAGGWQVLMAQGLGWGAQSWRRRAHWPREEITQLWNEGKRITTIAHGDGEWFVAFTEGTGITQQGWDTSTEVAPNAVADRRWADGYRITGLAWGGGSWAVISSQGTDLTQQTMTWGESFPEDTVRQRWSEGYEITALARSDTHWVVVMSRR